QGSFGNDCASCHTTKNFKESGSFDHKKETQFPLLGRHNEITCESCHVESAAVVKLSTSCNDCHQIMDVHHGLLGSKCEDCHKSQKWESTTFDHDKDSRFALRGAHLKVDCVGCHRTTPSKQDTLANCRSCHSGDDVHAGQLEGTCAACHNEKSWTAKVFFDHDLARFPLLGLHAALPCENCHASSQFHDAKMDCVDCHTKDDTHRRTLGTQCARCHNPNGWNIWVFDHGSETEFPLLGKHKDLSCKACHTESSELNVRTSKECYACHSREDPHRGRFGRNCEACHDDESWKNTRMMR
ncbi:MAG: cytochrome C, partial [Deltaproteobacteria bacterium]|nr:cytochrome C [Deltaproteobacteria bacterium]